MIIVTKCPLRISLAGGSTDLQEYLDKYGEGKVLSFTPDLFTYIILKKSSTKYYKVVYSRIENVLNVNEIQNDIAREVLTHFNMPPVEVVFTADIPSTGSGLASSSSYVVSLIKACLLYKQQTLDQTEIGKLGVEIERRFNPLAGYQDVYGCLLPGFKLLEFAKEGLTKTTPLTPTIFKTFDYYLIPTGVTRSSTTILSTLNHEEIHKLSNIADQMLESIRLGDYSTGLRLIQQGWEQKKETSPNILTPELRKVEAMLSTIPGILTRRLIGAGSGGYFLVICEKNTILNINQIPINLYED